MLTPDDSTPGLFPLIPVTARYVSACSHPPFVHVSGCDILLVTTVQNPVMIRFTCKYQPAIVSTMVAKWCRISSIHSIGVFPSKGDEPPLKPSAPPY